MTYLPKKGERVRVVRVAEEDPAPAVRVGDVVIAGGATCAKTHRGFIYLSEHDDTSKQGTWCWVEPAPEPPAQVRISSLPFTSEEMAGIGAGYVTVDVTPPAVPVFMSTDSAIRKLMPVATGCMQYFPDALLLVSWVSRVGNEKHNPGEPLHWAKEKSQDEKDAEVRHMLDTFRGLPPDPGLEPLGDLGHLASKAWRSLGDLQRACDAARAKYAAFPAHDTEPPGSDDQCDAVPDAQTRFQTLADARRERIHGDHTHSAHVTTLPEPRLGERLADEDAEFEARAARGYPDG